MENTILNKNLSHNLYSEECENLKINFRQMPKYLVLVENFINGEIKSEIIPALSITSAIEIAINQHKICEIYETRGASHEYHFYCQISGGQM